MYNFKSLFVILLSIFLISCSNGNIELTTNGKSNYEIVFPGNATESQYKSAEILKNYIDKISGVNIPIVDESSQNTAMHKIYVGNVNDQTLNAH